MRQIWRGNDRFKWSDATFDILKEILKERLGKIPRQGKPIYEHRKEKTEDNIEFEDHEPANKLLNSKTGPVFYNARETLKITKWTGWAAKAIVALTILYNILNFSTPLRIAQNHSLQNPNSAMVYLIAISIVLVNTAIGVAAVYFPLKALAHILTILMEMEFNSRKAE